MREKNLIKIVTFLSIISSCSSSYANVVWPALFVVSGIWESWPLIGISITIEALLFYWLLRHVSIMQAFLISLAGNLASTISGALIIALAMPLWHISFDEILGGTFSTYNIIVNYIFMYLGSSVIELLTIKALFKYPLKQLWTPVFIGNFLTYALVYFFRFHNEFIALLQSR